VKFWRLVFPASWLVVLMVHGGMTVAAPYEDDLAALTRGLPTEVRDFIDRRANCNHWLGEEAYDAERRAEILAALTELRCELSALANDEAVLKGRYAKNPDVLKALAISRDWSPG
jgi:hypothetical protein